MPLLCVATKKGIQNSRTTDPQARPNDGPTRLNVLPPRKAALFVSEAPGPTASTSWGTSLRTSRIFSAATPSPGAHRGAKTRSREKRAADVEDARLLGLQLCDGVGPLPGGETSKSKRTPSESIGSRTRTRRMTMKSAYKTGGVFPLRCECSWDCRVLFSVFFQTLDRVNKSKSRRIHAMDAIWIYIQPLKDESAKEK